MIVISDQLAASPDDDEPLTHPVLGWHNLVTVSNISATSEEAEHPASNLANPQTANKWRGAPDSPLSEEHIPIDVSGLGLVDYIAVVGHNWSSAGIPVSVEKLVDDSPEDWDELVGDLILPTDGPALFRFTPQNLSQIRFRLQPGSATPEAAVVYTGKLLTFERGVQGDFTPMPYGRVANVVTGRAESGDFMGRIITNSRTESAASFIGLSPAWVREHLVPVLDVIHAQPFFFAWSPSDFPLEVGFGWATNDPRPVFTLDGWVNFDLQMAGVV